MADVFLLGFLPDEWVEFRALLSDLVPDGAGLLRWDEWRFEDETRMRSAAVVRNQGGPSVEEIASRAVDRARARGFVVTNYEAASRRISLETADRVLRVWTLPLPPQVLVDLLEPPVRLELSAFPTVEVMLRLAATAGATTLKHLHLFAELDLERHDRFFAPSTEITVAGPYDRAALCATLVETGFSEDGDGWVRESGLFRAEVWLRDDVAVRVLPRR